MSLSRRLLNIARAEIKSAFRGLATSMTPMTEDERRVEDEIARARADREDRDRAEGRDPAERRAYARRVDEVPPAIARYYANLELPIGATADEVKAAYRRLMRRYHPDRHSSDDGQTGVATDLAQRLTEARDQILTHLGAS